MTTSPALKAFMDKTPTIIIDSGGRWVELEGFEEHLELVAERMGSIPRGFDRKTEREIGGIWESWVEEWIGFDLRSGETRKERIDTELTDGATVVSHHLGVSSIDSNAIRVRRIYQAGRVDVARATDNLGNEFADAIEKASNLASVTTLTADLLPNGIVPLRIEQTTEIANGKHIAKTFRRWDFVWK
jgi:hypothetical protein